MPEESDYLKCPLLLYGKVVTGFQRGSKELGFPTANLEFGDKGEEMKGRVKQGVYFGWARVGDGEVHAMAMSVGDNPHYKNIKVTVEVHILHKFEEDFYGQMVTCYVAGYIRPMTPFTSLDDLIKTIQSDCDHATEMLSAGSSLHPTRSHPFLLKPSSATAGDVTCLM
eukprot:TRINITY_DN8965_c1_g5_i1.p1 TRINITY_DN8965_c1_g5~~TRINITY_DN8965_c1_g5_i1.p1  ORF type:complete len:182 (+),score=35.72 TRINITY_DN8965_c1_g5_i1:43-546(+)